MNLCCLWHVWSQTGVVEFLTRIYDNLMASKTETKLPPPFGRNIIPTGFSSLRWLWKGWPLVQRFSDGEIIELKMIMIIIISCLTGEVGHMFKFDTCWYLELVWDLDHQRSLSGCYRRQAKANPSIRISADKHKRSLQSSPAVCRTSEDAFTGFTGSEGPNGPGNLHNYCKNGL